MLQDYSLVHCVGHGLLIRLDVIHRCGGWPAPLIGGEDLGLGFILKAMGYHVVPLPVLENAETPDTLRQLINQKAVWFLGTLGYGGYWRYIPTRPVGSRQFQVIGLTAQGLLDMANWLLAGPLISSTCT